MGTEDLGTTYAEGWYLVAWSDELPEGEARPLSYFGDGFVLYRDEAGAPRLLDAYCPHLGAHLGHGGKVEEGGLVCPFHAWRFDGTGRCTAIPYAKRIPPKAGVRAYPTVEHSGMILAFFAREGVTPTYDVPPIPQLGRDDWTGLMCAEIEVKTQAREVIENIADIAHFTPVHTTNIHGFEVEIDGPRATQRSTVGRFIMGQEWLGQSVATYHGPAVQLSHIEWAHPTVLINAHIPIDENRLLLRFAIAMEKPPGLDDPKAALQVHIDAIRDGYFQDVAIWENKRWRDTPTFVDGDGPIADIRRWYASFFATGADEGPVHVTRTVPKERLGAFRRGPA